MGGRLKNPGGGEDEQHGREGDGLIRKLSAAGAEGSLRERVGCCVLRRHGRGLSAIGSGRCREIVGSRFRLQISTPSRHWLVPVVYPPKVGVPPDRDRYKGNIVRLPSLQQVYMEERERRGHSFCNGCKIRS